MINKNKIYSIYHYLEEKKTITKFIQIFIIFVIDAQGTLLTPNLFLAFTCTAGENYSLNF